ncbi:unnamed protein product [Nippostrongylus brasiliensis]|uniref:GtrA domain-containing protein n=1 Tax=Nippostrongylus brasiliensis TaxID=27835 RepID=A0A158QZ06_NIPBR|nr:unnamed protein product [Nippostrongylus brasiliensis]
MGAPSRPSWVSYFPPLTFRSFLRHYLPASGAVSHTLFAVHIFNPSFVSRANFTACRMFTVGDLAVSNSILFTANIGLGFYVYFRHHLHRLRPWDRVEFSVFSTTMFNFGSLLAAVLIKALLPNRTPTWTRCLLGSALSVYLLTRAHKYLRYVDERSARKSPTPRSVRSPVTYLEKNGKASAAFTSPTNGTTVVSNGRDHHLHNGGNESGYNTLRSNGDTLP